MRNNRNKAALSKTSDEWPHKKPTYVKPTVAVPDKKTTVRQKPRKNFIAANINAIAPNRKRYSSSSSSSLPEVSASSESERTLPSSGSISSSGSESSFTRNSESSEESESDASSVSPAKIHNTLARCLASYGKKVKMPADFNHYDYIPRHNSPKRRGHQNSILNDLSRSSTIIKPGGKLDKRSMNKRSYSSTVKQGGVKCPSSSSKDRMRSECGIRFPPIYAVSTPVKSKHIHKSEFSRSKFNLPPINTINKNDLICRKETITKKRYDYSSWERSAMKTRSLSVVKKTVNGQAPKLPDLAP